VSEANEAVRPRQLVLATTRLAALLAAICLATSRVGLIVHELVGHGGTAIALGGQVSDFRLFWFAGGWIRYDFPGASREDLLAVQLGGVVLEGVIGAALWFLLARRDGIAVRILRGVGAALVIHAAWYFATGTWHGYGDGAIAYRMFGDLRYPAAMAGGLVACAMTFACARLVFGSFLAHVPGGRKAKIAGVALATVVAAGLQIGLALGEVSVRGDSTYGAIMRPERERVVARELAAWQREQQRKGAAIDAARRIAEQRRLAAKHPTEPPFAPVLAFALLAMVFAGAWRARASAGAITNRHVAIAAALAASSIVAVITIDAVFH
jgi:hypothetical protein